MQLKQKTVIVNNNSSKIMELAKIYLGPSVIRCSETLDFLFVEVLDNAVDEVGGNRFFYKTNHINTRQQKFKFEEGICIGGSDVPD